MVLLGFVFLIFTDCSAYDRYGCWSLDTSAHELARFGMPVGYGYDYDKDLRFREVEIFRSAEEDVVMGSDTAVSAAADEKEEVDKPKSHLATCAGCAAATTFREYIDHRKASHKGIFVSSKICDICGGKLTKKPDYKHVYRHFGPFDCPEDGCDTRTDVNEMYHHYVRVHKIKARFRAREGGFQKVGQ